MFHRSQATYVLPVAAVVLATIAPLAVLHGQVCAGFAPLDDTRYRVSMSTANHRYANAHGLSVAAGTDGAVYGVADLAWTYDDELAVSSYDVGIRLGADVPRDHERIAICPSASLTTSVLPRGQILSGERYLETWNIAGAVSLGIAVPAIETGRIAIRSGADLEVVRVWSWLRSGTYTDHTEELYWIAGAGISLIVGDRFTIRPGVSVPFRLLESPDDLSRSYAMPHGRMNREIALELKIGVNFGKRH